MKFRLELQGVSNLPPQPSSYWFGFSLYEGDPPGIYTLHMKRGGLTIEPNDAITSASLGGTSIFSASGIPSTYTEYKIQITPLS